MTKDEALKMALEAQERAWLWMENQADGQSKGGHATFDLMMLRDERDALRDSITAIKEALAQPEQEPVALQRDVIVVNLVREGINKHRARELAEHFSKHTTPPQRKPLTDEEIYDMYNEPRSDAEMIAFARAIEAKLKEKNT